MDRSTLCRSREPEPTLGWVASARAGRARCAGAGSGPRGPWPAPQTLPTVHAHVRFRGGQAASLTVPIPPSAWQARQTNPDTLALLDRLLDDHTDAEVAELLNEAGHRSGTGRPSTQGSCSSSAATAGSRAAATGSELPACSPSPRPPSGSASTRDDQGLARSRAARRPQGQRQKRATLADARGSTARQAGRRLAEREPIGSTRRCSVTGVRQLVGERRAFFGSAPVIARVPARRV